MLLSQVKLICKYREVLHRRNVITTRTYYQITNNYLINYFFMLIPSATLFCSVPRTERFYIFLYEINEHHLIFVNLLVNFFPHLYAFRCVKLETNVMQYVGCISSDVSAKRTFTFIATVSSFTHLHFIVLPQRFMQIQYIFKRMKSEMRRSYYLQDATLHKFARLSLFVYIHSYV